MGRNRKALCGVNTAIHPQHAGTNSRQASPPIKFRRKHQDAADVFPRLLPRVARVLLGCALEVARFVSSAVLRFSSLTLLELARRRGCGSSARRVTPSSLAPAPAPASTPASSPTPVWTFSASPSMHPSTIVSNSSSSTLSSVFANLRMRCTKPAKMEATCRSAAAAWPGRGRLARAGLQTISAYASLLLATRAPLNHTTC